MDRQMWYITNNGRSVSLKKERKFWHATTWINHENSMLSKELRHKRTNTVWLHLYEIPAAAKSLQSCLTLCDPIDGSPPGSAVPGILQARTLEWVAVSFSNAWKWNSESEVAQSGPTLSDSMDCSLPDSSTHGIFQARVLEWVAIAFSYEIPRLAQFTETESRTVDARVWRMGKYC